jgi:hypothetical protein
MAPRRGFEVPYGAIGSKGEAPSSAMSEWMDAVSQALTKIKTAASNMDTLDPSSATASDGANVLEQLRSDLSEIE